MNENTYMFEEMPISKAVAKLCIPTVLGSLVMVIYSMADTYFVGLLNDSVQTAAVTLASTVLLAFNAVSNLFGVGSSSCMSRNLGIKNYKMVKKSSAFGFYCSFFCAFLFSLFTFILCRPLLNLLGADTITYDATRSYLLWTVMLGAIPAICNVVLAYLVRSEGASLHASIGTMSGCILNIILDPIFIMPWGLNMKAAGAGCATFISNCFACLYFFVLIYKKSEKTLVSVKIKDFSFDRKIALDVLTVGVPASIQNLLNVTGATILNKFTASFGASAIAAMGIAHKVQMVPLQIALGASQGIMPLVSYNYASGNSKRMKEAILFIQKLMVGVLLAVTVVVFINSDFFIRLFMNNEEIIAYGGKFLKGQCLALPFLAIDFATVGVFQAIGDGKKAFIFALLRKIILEIPAIIILNMIWPLYGMNYAQVVAEIVLASAAIIMLRKIFKGLDSRKVEGE